MCSIFGYVARQNKSIDLGIVREIVSANISRGPHAFGFSWIDSVGTLRAYRQAGRLTDQMGALSMARDARMLIGHLRYATHGSPADNINNHPHPCDGGWVVHNGVIRNDDELVKEYRLPMVSVCDSEVLALLIERSQGARIERVVEGIDKTEGQLAMMGLWSRPGLLVAGRRGNPLHFGHHGTGTYLATLRDGMPGKATPMAEGKVVQFARSNGKIVMRSKSVHKARATQSVLFDDDGEYAGG